MNHLMPRILRGGSVFSPYLIPPIKMAKYMAQTGQLPIAVDQEGTNAPSEDASSIVAQQIVEDDPESPLEG